MKIPSLAELQAVCLEENLDPLIDLKCVYRQLCCTYRRKESGVTSVLVRKAVAEKLQRVNAKLQAYNPYLELVIVEGYRTAWYQERYFLKQLLEEYKESPELDFEALLQQAHACVALPSVAGHPTGGAVDLTIASKGTEIDMGCAIADFSKKHLIATHSPEISREAAANRALLHDLMLEENFAPYYGEWWHFSYGDREWAAFYGHAKSLYAPMRL